MTEDRIYLSQSHPSGKEGEFVMNSENWIAVNGANISRFETELENYLGQQSFVTALNSGTSALHLALVLLGVKYGDEVLCQTLTFSASVNPIVYLGAKPIFIDSESNTWNLCPIHLENAILQRILITGTKPKAIIAVHLYGMPYNHDAIKTISLKYDIPIIEDSAEALGSQYKGIKCGTLGDISILSFNGNKIITTSGGGAIVVKSYGLKEKAIFLGTQARDKAPHYQHSSIGYNYRMNNISAGIGISQMQVLDSRIEKRREINQFYRDFFKDCNGVRILKEPSQDYFSNHWLTVVLLENYERREELRLEFEKANIETRPLWKPMHMQPVYKDCLYYGDNVSEVLFQKGLCLPSSSNLTRREKNRIIAVLQHFF